jgi:hypothetical protein
MLAQDRRTCHNVNVSFQPLAVVGGQNESLYDSRNNRGTHGACTRPDGRGKGGGKLGQKSDEQIAAEQQKKKNEENAYKDALKKIPDQPVKQKDPWANTR